MILDPFDRGYNPAKAAEIYNSESTNYEARNTSMLFLVEMAKSLLQLTREDLTLEEILKGGF